MKNTLLAIAAALVLLLAGFYFYSIRGNQASTVTPEDLIPADAVIIYQNKKPSFAKRDSPDLASWIRRLLRQDSIFISPLRANEILLSLHITGKEDFGVIYYLPDSAILQDISFKKFITKGKPKKRNFEGYSITELPSATNGNISYTAIGRNIIFSRQSLLIEDVIRSYTEEKSGFKKRNNELFHMMPTDAGQGKIYANVNALAKFSGLFLNADIPSILFRNFGSALISDAKIEGDVVTFNGFATDSAANESSFLSLFNDQHPAASSIQKIVSNRALFFVHYGIPDYKTWINKRKPYHAYYTIASPDQKKAADFYEGLGDESGFFFLDGSKGETEEVIIQEIKKSHEKDLVKILSGDEPPLENYSNYPVYAASSPETMGNLLWPLIESKNAGFYIIYNQYFVFAENIEILKGFINDIEEDNTWGKSSEWNTFFNSSSLETNVSMELNGTLLIPWLSEKLSNRWDSLSMPRQLSMFEKGSFQFSRLNHSYYFNGVFQFDPSGDTKENSKTEDKVPQISFGEDITSVVLVKNHSTNAAEIFVQTSANNVALLNDDLSILFKLELKDKIVGRVFQIDYYKNKKLQYLFLAGNSLYLIDRLGKIVSGFPVAISTPSEPEFLSVLDYDNTRNYRFLISDRKANFQMTDKEGKPLEGWGDQAVQGPLLNAPRLIRSAGKDYIIAVNSQGVIYAFNRKGEKIKDFPVSTGSKPQGDWFLERKSNDGDDVITMITSDGVKTQTDLKGKLRSKENYVRSAPDSKFAMTISSSPEDYVVSRIDKSKIALLTRKGDVIFEKENPGSDVMETSLFISNREKVFLFSDTQQDFVYIFDDKGNAIFDRPLESSQLPLIRKSKAGLIVFTVLGHSLSKTSH